AVEGVFILQPVSSVYVTEGPERVSQQMRSVTADVSHADHHVARQLALDLEVPHLHHGVMRRFLQPLKVGTGKLAPKVSGQRSTKPRSSQAALVYGGITQGEGHTLPRIRLTARVPTVVPSVEIYISGDRTRASLAGRVQGREGIGVEDIVSSPEDRLAILKRRPGK